jgi:opacity protein-like surface antigen
MRRLVAVAIAVLFSGALAQAQIPSGNIFVGYSLSQVNSFGGTKNLNGWEGSLEGKFLPWIGIVGDFSAGYGTDNSFATINGCSNCVSFNTSLRRNTYLIGPRVSIPIGRFTPFAHALFGVAHINDQGSTDNSFATAVGGGLDYRLIKGIAWRFQLDNVHTSFFSVGANNLRFSTGIDVRF